MKQPMLPLSLTLAALAAVLLQGCSRNGTVSEAKWPPDCDKVNLKGLGPLLDGIRFNDTAEDGTLVFVVHPPLTPNVPYPVIVFSHGSTGEYAMYEGAIKRYASHGFVVVFPHIKGPEEDTSPFTLDPMGGFTLKGLRYAVNANSNASSILHNMLDMSNVILAGHSMGASSTIMAARELPAGSVKAAYAQHPGLCGPLGPPPCVPGSCHTWMPADFKEAAGKHPLFLSTATNDGAFLPAPHTAPHEYGCYNKSVGASSKGSAFVQFATAWCQDDGTGHYLNRTWSTGGHDCPLQQDSVETQWLLVVAKLYAQLNGDSSSQCARMFWGSGADSLTEELGKEVEKLRIDAGNGQLAGSFIATV